MYYFPLIPRAPAAAAAALLAAAFVLKKQSITPVPFVRARFCSIFSISLKSELMSFILDQSGASTLSGVTFPAGVTYLSARYNSLTSLAGVPSTVRVLDVTGNPALSSLSGIPASLRQLRISECALTSLVGLPATLVTLDASNNALTSTAGLEVCTNITAVNLSGNAGLTSLAGVPSSCLTLLFENTSLTSLAGCPTSLVIASFRNNSAITSAHMASLPTGGSLRRLDLRGTAVQDVSGVPPSVAELVLDMDQSLSSVVNTIVQNTSNVSTQQLQLNSSGNSGSGDVISGSSVESSACCSGGASAAAAARLSFMISSVEGSAITSNAWKQLAPQLYYSKGGSSSSGSLAPELRKVYVVTSLKSIASIDLRIVSTDTTPYRYILPESVVNSSNSSDSNGGTAVVFSLGYPPAKDCVFELQGRLGSAVAGNNTSSRYGVVYSCVMHL